MIDCIQQAQNLIQIFPATKHKITQWKRRVAENLLDLESLPIKSSQGLGLVSNLCSIFQHSSINGFQTSNKKLTASDSLSTPIIPWLISFLFIVPTSYDLHTTSFHRTSSRLVGPLVFGKAWQFFTFVVFIFGLKNKVLNLISFGILCY